MRLCQKLPHLAWLLGEASKMPRKSRQAVHVPAVDDQGRPYTTGQLKVLRRYALLPALMSWSALRVYALGGAGLLSKHTACAC